MQLTYLAKRLVPSTIKPLLRPFVPRGLGEAEGYVANDKTGGQLQLELLTREGCVTVSKVLEIGCGTLHAAIPMIQFLQMYNYIGVDPNKWLRRIAMKDRCVRELVKRKHARFLSVDDF